MSISSYCIIVNGLSEVHYSLFQFLFPNPHDRIKKKIKHQAPIKKGIQFLECYGENGLSNAPYTGNIKIILSLLSREAISQEKKFVLKILVASNGCL